MTYYIYIHIYINFYLFFNLYISISEQSEPLYKDMLHQLSKDWLLLELHHKISRTGSNAFWNLSKDSFPKLIEAKKREANEKKIPQSRTLRDKLYRNYVPPISLEIAYECKATGDVIIMEDLKTIPTNVYPPTEFTKLYEKASVKVSFFSHTYVVYIQLTKKVYDFSFFPSNLPSLHSINKESLRFFLFPP